MLLTNNTDSSGLCYIRLFHVHIIEMGHLSDKFLENALVNMYVKLESLATLAGFSVR